MESNASNTVDSNFWTLVGQVLAARRASSSSTTVGPTSNMLALGELLSARRPNPHFTEEEKVEMRRKVYYATAIMGVDDETLLARSEEIEAEGAQAVRRIIADVHSTTGREWEVPSEMKKMVEDLVDLGVDPSIGAEEFFAKLMLYYAKFRREKRLKREYANACQRARRQERRQLQRYLEDN